MTVDTCLPDYYSSAHCLAGESSEGCTLSERGLGVFPNTVSAGEWAQEPFI